jgi:hypothetical protein
VVENLVVCECAAGYSGDLCQLKSTSSFPIIILVVGFIVLCVIVALIVVLWYRNRHNGALPPLKDLLTSKVFNITSVRYSRHPSSVTTNNHSVEYGIFNEACEEYDLEEITTDQSHLMEQTLEENVI